MQKICKNSWCQTPFEVTDSDRAFYLKISPTFGGQNYLIPEPTKCPPCRRQRRLAFRNERSFYNGTCSKCQKPIITVYSPNKQVTIYCRDCWWGDSWNALYYGRDYNFNKPFFQQFADLSKKVPRIAMINIQDENSDYTNYGYQNKDCYLLSTSDENEKCSYGCFVWSSYNCFDCLFVLNSQNSYECIDCDNVYECQYCRECENCQNCFGCFDCKGSKNCFGSVGLRNKEYYFFNQQLSKEEYQARVKEALANRKETMGKIENQLKNYPRRASFLINCENCTGDHLKNCKNMQECYDGKKAEDCKWVTNFPHDVFHCRDIDGCGILEWSAECVSTGADGSSTCFACEHVWYGASSVYYSAYCVHSKNIFGSVGLQRGEHTILNKKYSKEEYEELAPRIIEHMKSNSEWGEFFPMSLSLFGYNETKAQEDFPLTQQQAHRQNTNWSNYQRPEANPEKIIQAAQLPTEISQIPDDVLSWAIQCEQTQKPFMITKPELTFYRQYNIPIPYLHPDERYLERRKKRNPQQLWSRTCNQCRVAIMTSYAPNRPEKVLCEQCYQAKVY
jgi:hypothetical protein